jgi:hypothetical protein
MYATAVFEFDQGNNGWLMFEFAFVQSIFLIFMFPTIISKGRKWFKSGNPPKEVVNDQPNDTAVLPTSPRQFEAPAGPLDEGEPVALEPAKERTSCEFDLFFLRWSLVVDGALTTIAAFATQRWHIYLGKLLHTSTVVCFLTFLQLHSSSRLDPAPRLRRKESLPRCAPLLNE